MKPTPDRLSSRWQRWLRRWRIRAVVEPIAKEHDATTSQISSAWLLQHSPAKHPVPGTTSIDHLRQNLEAEQIHLSDAEVEELDALAGPGQART